MEDASREGEEAAGNHSQAPTFPCASLALFSSLPLAAEFLLGKHPVLQNQPFTRQEVEAQLGISTHPKIIGCQEFDGLPGAGVCGSVTLCSCRSRRAVAACCWAGPRVGTEAAASISGNSHARNQGHLLLGEEHKGYFWGQAVCCCSRLGAESCPELCGVGMLPSCCPASPAAGTHNSLLSLLQGPVLGPF